MLKHCTSSNSDLRLGRRPLSPPSLPPRFAICSDTISLSSSCSSSSPHLYSIQDIDIEFSDMGDDSAAPSINQDQLNLSSSELHPSLSIPAFKPPVPERKISLSVSAPKERPPLTTPSLLTQLNHSSQHLEKSSQHQSSHQLEISSHQSDLCNHQVEKSSNPSHQSSHQVEKSSHLSYQSSHKLEKSSHLSHQFNHQLEKSSHPTHQSNHQFNHPLNQSSHQLEKSSHPSHQSSHPFNQSLHPIHQFNPQKSETDSPLTPSLAQRKSPPPHVRYGSSSPISPKKPPRELGARHSTSLRSIPSFFTKKPQLKVLKPLSLSSRPLPTFLPARKSPMQGTLPAPKPPLLGSRSCTFTQSSLRVEPEDRQSPVLVQCRWFNSPVPDADVTQFNGSNQLEEDSNEDNNEAQEIPGEEKECQVTVNVSSSSTEDSRNNPKDDMKEPKDDVMFTSTPKSSVATNVELSKPPMLTTNSPKPPISLKPTISIKSDQESYKYSVKPAKSVQIAGVDDIRSSSHTPLESSSFSPIEKSQNSVQSQSVGPCLSLMPMSFSTTALNDLTSSLSVSKSEEAPKYLSATPTQLISSTPPSTHPYSDNSRSTSAIYSDTPRCTMKVYAKCLAPDIEYKTVSVGPAMTSRELVWLLLSKYRMKHRDPKLFYLTMDVTIRRTGIPIKRTMVLEEEARPAELKTCNPWGECKFSLQMKKGGLVRIHDSVLMEESKYKCLLISEDTTVEDVIRILLNCYGLERVEEVSCFCVYEVANCRERRLGRHERPLSVQSTWPSSSGGRQPSWPGQHQNNWSHQQPRLVLRRATRSVSNQVPEETCVDDEEDNKMDVSYSSNESTCSEVAAAFTLCPSPSLYPSTLPLAALMSLSCPPSHFSAPSLSPVSLAADMDIDIVKGPSLGSLSSESNFSDYEHFFYI